MHWYVLRVAANKEMQVKEALERKTAQEGLTDVIGRIEVPTEQIKRIRGGKQTVHKRKLYPGYVFVEMATELDGSIPEAVWFLVKETMGVGDFIGSDNKPTSMRDHDVEMMLLAAAKKEDEEAALQGLEFAKGDRVNIYLPMIPEAAVARLACARIGAAHSVVFGGFSAQSLTDRINCLLYTSPSPRDRTRSRMPSSA